MRLARLAEALERQTLWRARWEVIVVLDGGVLDASTRERLSRLGARVIQGETRRGPGAARNRGAGAATGAFLAFTEDDCAPAPDWLERAAGHAVAAPEPDVIVGETLSPGGRPTRRPGEGEPHYLPTNLFVRRDAFDRAGGYCEAYFDPETGAYFREDSDLGFALESHGARVVRAPDVLVEHPDEHPRALDPLRWARRYAMDPLLAARHPRRFRERIEVHRVGPFRIRRPVVRSSLAFLVALGAAPVAALTGSPGMAWALLALAGATLIPLWAKWRFDPRRLPILPLVPFVLAAALIRGRTRLRGLGDAARSGATAPG